MQDRELIALDSEERRQNIIVPSLTTGPGTDSIEFMDYIELSRANHQKKIEVTRREVAIAILPVALSIAVGFLASLVYKEYAAEAADNELDLVLNVIGAIVLNTVVNIFFQYIVTAPPFESLFETTPPDQLAAMANLQERDTSLLGRTLHYAATGVTMGAVAIPSAAAAYPIYALDIKKGTHPLWLSLTIFASSFLLQYKGVETLLFKIVPATLVPFKALYRKLNKQARLDFKIEETVRAMKAAHLDALERAYQEFLKLIQTDQTAALAPIIALLKKSDPTKSETLRLIFLLLKLAPSETFQPSQIIKALVQVLSLIVTTGSLAALFIITMEAAADYENIPHGSEKAWVLGSSIFFVSVILAYWVSCEVFGATYDGLAYAWQGIKKGWHQAPNVQEFFQNAWAHKFDMASWYELLRFPRAISQNPRIMLSTIAFFYILSLKSTQSATDLNTITFTKKIADFLKLPTIVAIIAFNIFPVDKILALLQRFLTRCFGKEENVDQIRLEQFLQDQISLVNSITDSKFIDVLQPLARDPDLTPEQSEDLLKLFCGNKTSTDLYGEDNEFANTDLRSIVPRLKNKEIQQLRQIQHLREFGFFREDPVTAEERKGFNNYNKKDINLGESVSLIYEPL